MGHLGHIPSKKVIGHLVYSYDSYGAFMQIHYFLVDQSYCFVVVFLGVGTIQRLFARRLRTKAPKAMRLGPECSKAIAKWVWIQMSPLTSITTIIHETSPYWRYGFVQKRVFETFSGLWWYVMVYDVYIILYFIILYHIIWHHIIWYHIILYYIIL